MSIQPLFCHDRMALQKPNSTSTTSPAAYLHLMASSLLLLLDDIASVLDDVSAMTKVAVKKTAGVLGDDLALNAKQVTGVATDRELPVVWQVARGSLLNKALLVPAALLLNWLLPAAVLPLLMAGGLYLCYEGAEKILHRLHHHQAAIHHTEDKSAATAASLATLERTRIRGAVRTDFILSAEIIVITLGIVASRPILVQLGVLVTISLAMTVGVYGLVTAIVKLDDAGLWLMRQPAVAAQTLGRGIVATAPWLMRILTVIGTAAMFLVGGGILLHGVPAWHHAVEEALHGLADFAAIGMLAVNGLTGLLAGCLVLATIQAGRTLLTRAG
jgi:predicted DNA repair protein MutK